MGAATCGKGTNPIRMRNFARLTSRHTQIFAGHGSPGDIRRASAPPAIDAMTVTRGKRPTLQHVSCPAANASTSELHIICLAHFNHEFTRMNTNSCSPPEARRRPRFHSPSTSFPDWRGTLFWRSELYSLSSLDEFNRSSTP
jgi:hypothetical protein